MLLYYLIFKRGFMSYISDYFSNKTDAKSHLPGGLPIWIFIFAEMTEFALFFIVFIVVKMNFKEDFNSGPSSLNINFAIINTVILITSSFFVAKATKLVRKGLNKKSVYCLLTTITLGALYCLVKYNEYQWNSANGITMSTNYFFTCYYYLTFNHLLHVLIAMFVLIITAVQTAIGHYGKDNYNGFEGGASYWHMIDLVWMILFPLLYVLA